MAVPTLMAVESLLRSRLTQPLPGAAAQLRFAPSPLRDAWAPDLEPEAARRAGVLIVIYPGAEGPAIPLTLRHRALPQHAGQVSLPGGAIDPGEGPAAAALREAEEELGISTTEVRVLGALSTLWVAVSNFVVHPFVAIADRAPHFQVDPREVDALLEVPLAHLCDPSRIAWAHHERDGVVVDYPYFDVAGHHVWGATAIMLGEFACLFESEHGPGHKEPRQV